MLRKSQPSLQAFSKFLNIHRREYAAKNKKSAKESSSSSKVPISDVYVEDPLSPGYFVRTVGSSYRQWGKILEKHPELKTIKRKDITNSWEKLKALNFTIEDVLTKPMLLYYNALTLGSRYNVLTECAFQTITASMLAKYVTVMNKTVAQHKSFGYLPFDLNMVERLKSCFTDLEVRIPNDYPCDENMELKMLRQQILNCYLKQRLAMSNDDIEKLWKVYARIRHKSFKSVQDIIQVLENELQFPKERIIKNAYLLHGDAENITKILRQIKMIDGQDVRSIVYRRPKILMSNCEAIMKTLEYVKAYGINEAAVIRCSEVLTLGPETVLERLRDLNEIEEFQVLGTNPRVLRLVHYQNKARLRLEYLNQLKVRCASLHILSCGSEAFAKFARDGSDRTKGRDIVVYLAHAMKKDEDGIRSLISRHPNWCHIPVIQVKQCYDFLLSRQFENDDIYNNIHILLYPISRIEEKLSQIHTSEFLDDAQTKINVYQLKNSEILTLIMYLIEFEFHFTGDGIWTEQHGQHVENFKNLLPDFPDSLNKIYKYGVKPAAANRNLNSPSLVMPIW